MRAHIVPGDPLPDLFAGSQLVVVGRYRDQGTATVTLTGLFNGQTQTYTYKNLAFPDNAGGQAFIPRLWATRKIGVLLNQIRLNGQTPELVDSVVRLSVRYGIITPYTSYLIQEGDINAQTGGEQPGQPVPVDIQPSGPGGVSKSGGVGGGTGAAMSADSGANAPVSGAAAVDKAQKANDQAGANQVAAAPTSVPSPT